MFSSQIFLAVPVAGSICGTCEIRSCSLRLQPRPVQWFSCGNGLDISR